MTFFPPTITSPEDTVSCPAIALSVDVLPHPDGPSKQQYWSAVNLNDTLDTAVTLSYRMQRSITSSAFINPHFLFLYLKTCAKPWIAFITIYLYFCPRKKRLVHVPAIAPIRCSIGCLFRQMHQIGMFAAPDVA